MGVLGFDSNKVSQKTVQQQVGVESGVGFGALSAIKSGGAVFGGGSSGNISFAKQSLGKGASSEINILTNDPATALKALEANQELSTLAISYANTNALSALETLRTLQAGNIVANTPGATAETVGATLTGSTVEQPSDTQATVKTGIVVFALVVGLGLYIYYKRRG